MQVSVSIEQVKSVVTVKSRRFSSLVLASGRNLLRRPALAAFYILRSKTYFNNARSKNMPPLPELFGARSVVFTVTAGRTGTDTLSKVFSQVPGVWSVHEPKPGYDIIARAARRNPNLACGFGLWKAEAISSINCEIYIETSHVLCKGFLETFLALGLRPKIIILDRDARAVARSLFNKNAIPGRTPAGKGFLISPEEKVFLGLKGWRELSDYELCFWYVLEMQTRARVYAEVFQHISVSYINIKTPELNSLERIRELADFIGVRLQTEDKWLFGHQNVSRNRSDLLSDTYVHECERRIHSRIYPKKTAEDVLREISRLQAAIPSPWHK